MFAFEIPSALIKQELAARFGQTSCVIQDKENAV